MNIFVIHNKYKRTGGEDFVFEQEVSLLKRKGNIVDEYTVDNKLIVTKKDKLRVGFLGIYNPNICKELKYKLLHLKPEILHVHNFFPIISPSVFYLAAKMKIPVVLTLHNYRLICPNALLYRDGKVCEDCKELLFPWKGVIRRCYRNSAFQTLALSTIVSFHKLIKTWKTKVDKYIVLTEFQKRKFLESSLGISEKKFAVKPNFSVDYGVGKSKREPFFLYVGRLSKEKGIATLLEAFKQLKFTLKIVGDGNLKDLVRDYANRYPNIEYLGFQPKDKVISLMKRCRALVFPSECYEGFPMVLVEAFSTGTPVISSDIGSQAEIVKDQYNGVLFKAGDSRDLVSKVKLFAKFVNQDYYNNARKEYLEKYTPEKNYEQLIQIYEEVLSARKKKNH